MSLLWGYDARKCDGEYCPNNCDICYKAEIEADGFITRPEVLEKISARKAQHETVCGYPVCEACPNYVEDNCTVPMVFSKQISKLIRDVLTSLDERLTEVEKLVVDEILNARDES